MSADVLHIFFDLQLNIKLYHWTTQSYSRHKGSDLLLERLNAQIDRYVESYIGRHGRASISKGSVTYKMHSDSEMCAYLTKTVKLIEALQLNDYKDLSSIRDDMVEDMYNTLYAFTLK